MEIVVPTNKLRFVERNNEIRTALILQQWWASTTKYGSGQWRDVPIEQESA